MSQRRSKKSPRPNSRRKGTKRIPAWKGPAPLLFVDQTPFLKEAVTRCKRAISKVKRCRGEMAAFETDDQPAFEAWKARTFGPLLSELRELGAAVGEKMQIADYIEWAIYHHGVPEHEAFDYVMNHRRDPEYRHPVYDAEDSEEDDGESDDFGEFDDDEEEEWADEAFFQDLFENLFGRHYERCRGSGSGKPKSGKSGVNGSLPSAAAKEIKSLYRKLARRLHPDTGAEQTVEAREQWAEAHGAYRRGDLDTLRALDAVSEMEGRPITVGLGLARLEAIRLHHEHHFMGISQARAELKRNQAWGFAKINDRRRDRIERELQYKYECDLEELRYQFRALEESIESMKKLAIEEQKRREKEKSRASARFSPEEPKPQASSPQKRAPKPRKSRKETRQAKQTSQTEFSF